MQKENEMSALSEILNKYFPDSPELETDYIVNILEDSKAMKIKTIEGIESIIDLHLADASLNDAREINSLIKKIN